LFTGFLMLGMLGFGGVLPLSRRVLVEQKRWLDGDDYLELLSLCQFLPGGNIANMSAVIGYRFRGAKGAIASLLGLIAMPTLVVVALGLVYDRFEYDPHVRHVIAGLTAAAAGLLVALAVRIVLPLRARPAAFLVVAAAAIGIGVLKWPLLTTMLIMAPVSILATYLADTRRRPA
jgi:chromate transporter